MELPPFFKKEINELINIFFDKLTNIEDEQERVNTAIIMVITHISLTKAIIVGNKSILNDKIKYLEDLLNNSKFVVKSIINNK